MAEKPTYEELKRRIQDLEKVESELILAEDRLKKIFDNTQDAILIHDLDGKTLDVNDQMCRMYGLTKEEALEVTIENISSSRMPMENLLEKWQKVLNGEKLLFEWEARRPKDHSVFNVEVSIQKISFHDKDIVLANVRDIAERKRAEEEQEKLQSQLLQAQKMESVGILAGGVAHDFNNLLQVIRGNMELLEQRNVSDSQFPSRISTITKSLDRAAQLVKQLLFFSRKAESQKVQVDLNQEMESMTRILERTIPKMINLDLHLDPALWPISGDPVQIEQILINLANNSVDAMPNGGRLCIETSNVQLDQNFVRLHPGSSTGLHVLLTVSDTGSGMDRETLAHIFDPFFTTKEVGKGTGLGLASVYGIVKAHNGYIQCYSESGQGTTFRIYLPALERGDLAAVDPEQETFFQGGNEIILMVDDDLDIRELTTEYLEMLGYCVQCAASGEDALKVYQDSGNGIDLVLLDLNMPGMGGYKCLKELMRIDPKVNVVIASGYTANSRGEDVFSAGARGFIGKPYQLKELTAKIREILDAD
ncbi:MAG: response regulator [Desulfovibrionales bacterium]|nr:response regulator [Desulfovibrionales bacterium]